MLNELKKFGLSEKEAKVYTAALELEKATVQNIAKKSGINRATVYVMAAQLEKLGLIKTVKVGKRSFLAAESPNVLLEILKKEKQVLEEKEREIKEALPELKSVYNIAPGRPKIRFFEGEESYQKITGDILESGAKEILEIYNADSIRNVMSKKESEDMFTKRMEKGIRSKAIYTRSEGPYKNHLELTEEKFLNKNEFPVNGDIFIYGNRVGMVSPGEKSIGVIIESEEISQTMKIMFDLAWKAAGEIKSEEVEEENLLEEN